MTKVTYAQAVTTKSLLSSDWQQLRGAINCKIHSIFRDINMEKITGCTRNDKIWYLTTLMNTYSFWTKFELKMRAMFRLGCWICFVSFTEEERHQLRWLVSQWWAEMSMAAKGNSLSTFTSTIKITAQSVLPGWSVFLFIFIE